MRALTNRMYRRGFAALIAVTFLLTPGIARAGSTTCHFAGTGAGVQVGRVELPQGGGRLVFVLGGQRPVYGAVNRSNYYGSEGVIIMNAAGRIEAYFLRGVIGQPPRIVASNGSIRAVDVTGVGPDSPLGWDQAYLPEGLAEGTHYVIAFGVGGMNYDDSATIGGPPSTCEPVPIDAEQVHFDNTDFQGGRQNFIPYVGGQASNATLTFTNSHQFFAGYILSGGQGVHSMHLNYQTPAPGPSGAMHQPTTVGATWPTGDARFDLSYQGTYPASEINGWAFTFK